MSQECFQVAPSSGVLVDVGRLQLLEQAVEAADALELWLGANAGCSADWPVDLHCRYEELANKLAHLLADLQMRPKPLRQMNVRSLRAGITEL